MTLDLQTILILSTAAALYAALAPARWRGWALLVGSVVAIYWLQPALPIRFSDFILPTTTLLLAVMGWWITRRTDDPAQLASLPEDRKALFVIMALVVGLSFMRFIDVDWRMTASRPPHPALVTLALLAIATAVAGAGWLTRHRTHDWQRLLVGATLLIIALFVALKTEVVATTLAQWWRGQTGQVTALATMVDLGWLGFSYVAFRLIHTFRDRQMGLLPTLSLREYVTYIIFFPAFVAGPIDRADRFTADLRGVPGLIGLDAARFTAAGSRIMVGLFKKFVIADSLAQGMSLTAVNADQINTTAGLWLLLYGYGLRLYFDFSGYTDIAIGLGLLLGLKLPENFDRPYLKTNLTTFWQSWHATLSQWARTYIFLPLSRSLLRRRAQRPWLTPTLITLLSQMATMVVIGLWHGITLNFFIWGVWHGMGLFAHKQWSSATRAWYRRLETRPVYRRAWAIFAWGLTFHYVLLGWVWFALPDTGQAVKTLGRLLAIGSRVIQ